MPPSSTKAKVGGLKEESKTGLGYGAAAKMPSRPETANSVRDAD